MQKPNHCVLSIILILTLLLSGISDTRVSADENSPTQETTEVQETQEEGPAAQSEETSEPTTESTAVTEGTTETTPTAADASETEVPAISEETESPTPLPTSVTETTEGTPEEGEPETLPELLESVPEGTDVIILNEEGDVEPLASENAAETFVEGDPIWCPDSQAPTPGLNGCTASFTSFTALITELETGAYSGNGTIWVAYDYAATEDNDTILFNGLDPALSGISSNSLTIQGGWSGTSGDTSYNTATPSTIDVSLIIDYWNGDVTLSNIFINNTTDTDTGVGLYIDADGDVTLSNVEVSGTTGTTDPGDGDGAVIGASGDVLITDSTFDHNDGYGLDVSSGGSITVDNVSASDNILMGAYLDTFLNGLGSGSVSVTGGSIFNDNGSIYSLYEPGLLIDSYASTTLENVTASDNFWAGIVIYNGEEDMNHTVSISNVNVSGNYGEGLYLEQYGDGLVSLFNVFASFNDVGSNIDTLYGHADVEIASSTFVENYYYGLIVDTNGDVAISDTISGSYGTYGGNGDLGVGIDSQSGTITITNSEFNDNGDYGLEIYAKKSLTLIDVIANGNGDTNVLVDTTVPSKACYCPEHNFVMTVKGGSFSNSNTGIELNSYGEDKLILGTGINAPIFDSDINDVIWNTTIIPECSNCGCGTEKPEGKPYKFVDVPDSGIDNVPQECSIYAGTILKMADGSYVKIACPFSGFSSLETITESDLPGALESGDMLDIGILLGLLDEDGSFVINSDGTITITFTIPAERRDHKHRMLFWDTAMNDGEGGWYEMPEHHFGGSIALHSDDPDDPRRIFTSVQQGRETVTVTVNFSGYFLLVSEQ